MIKVLSTLAVQGPLPGLAIAFEGATGVPVACTFAPTNGLLARLAEGEQADVAILTRAALDDLARSGVVLADSITDIAISEVGLAVKAGTAKPDISTVDALKSALIDAKSIAYSRIGASGVFFANLIERLGIADAVNVKSTIIPAGLTAELAARGEVELAVQQVSELMLVPGIEVVGALPAGAESVTMFSGGTLARAEEPKTARQFLAHLRSEPSKVALAGAGLRAAP